MSFNCTDDPLYAVSFECRWASLLIVSSLWVPRFLLQGLSHVLCSWHTSSSLSKNPRSYTHFVEFLASYSGLWHEKYSNWSMRRVTKKLYSLVQDFYVLKLCTQLAKDNSSSNLAFRCVSTTHSHSSFFSPRPQFVSCQKHVVQTHIQQGGKRSFYISSR